MFLAPQESGSQTVKRRTVMTKVQERRIAELERVRTKLDKICDGAHHYQTREAISRAYSELGTAIEWVKQEALSDEDRIAQRRRDALAYNLR
jgi:hypothetical protein